MILAIKYNEDDYFSNEFYSKVGGVSNSEFNKIESDAYFLINHSLYIDCNLYDKYNLYLSKHKLDSDDKKKTK